MAGSASSAPPPRIVAAAAAVARDLRRADIAFTWAAPSPADPDEIGTVYATLADGEGLGGWSLPAHLDGARLRCVLAEWLQDALAESDAAWAQPCPPCPGHAHPAQPEERDGEAWWTCPQDGRAIARVGAL
jgi:hypothetical protein